MPYTQPLFRPLQIRSVTMKNRIVLAPMCQYAATDGVADDWHVQHAGARAAGGAGMVMVEATHVSAIGRITHGCLGLWNDDQQAGLARVAKVIERCGAVPAIQIGHTGRKAATAIPWEEVDSSRPEGHPMSMEEGGWQAVAPSPIPFKDGYQTPRELTGAEIGGIIGEFAESARRAREAGFRVLEIHGAHGYLVHAFRSAFSNQRSDGYGGSIEKRRRFLMEVIDAVRGEWPEELPLFVRLSCDEYAPGGIDIADTIDLSRAIHARGDVDLIDCSSGGGTPTQRIPSVHPGYQVPFAEAIRREVGIATGAVGLISAPSHANEIVGNDRADLVFIGRAMLADPAWPQRAAAMLKADLPLPGPYQRAILS